MHERKSGADFVRGFVNNGRECSISLRVTYLCRNVGPPWYFASMKQGLLISLCETRKYVTVASETSFDPLPSQFEWLQKHFIYLLHILVFASFPVWFSLFILSLYLSLSFCLSDFLFLSSFYVSISFLFLFCFSLIFSFLSLPLSFCFPSFCPLFLLPLFVFLSFQYKKSKTNTHRRTHKTCAVGTSLFSI
jgi:hypothetical protein